MKYYKIRKRETGLYSTGGLYSTWNKTGKAWNTRGHLTNHLKLFTKSEIERFYKGCEIVEFELVELGVMPLTGDKNENN